MKKYTLKISKNSHRVIILILQFICLFHTNESNAQWHQKGPQGGSFKIVENLGTLYSTNAFGLYTSTDQGTNWNRISGNHSFRMIDLIFTPTHLLAITNNAIYRSTDGGINWIKSNQGVSAYDSSNIGDGYLKKLQNGRIIYSLFTHSYYSDDNGLTWTANASLGSNEAIEVCDSFLLARSYASSPCLKISYDNGDSWQVSSSNGIDANDLAYIKQILYFNNEIYLSGPTIGTYKSSDNGNTWQAINNGFSGSYYSNIMPFNNKLYKESVTQTFEYDFNNNLWIPSILEQTNHIQLLGYANGRYFGKNQVQFQGLVYSDNDGLTWNNSYGIYSKTISKLTKSDKLYAHSNFTSYAYDSLLSEFNLNDFMCIANIPSYVYDIKHSSNGTLYLANQEGIWKSTNNGISFLQCFNGLPQAINNTYPVYEMFIKGSAPNDTIYAATNNGIYFSADGAQSFVQIPITTGLRMAKFLYYKQVLYCAGGGLFKLGINNSWTQFTNFSSYNIAAFDATDDYLFINKSPNDPLQYAHINGLSNFTNINIGSTISYANAIATFDTLVFFTNSKGVFKFNTNALPTISITDIVNISDNLPFFVYSSPAVAAYKVYPYMYYGDVLKISDNKLWLGTLEMSNYYRNLSDFGYTNLGENEQAIKSENSSTYVFPNPSQKSINISNFKSGDLLTISDLHGSIVYAKLYTNSSSIDVSALQGGVYFYSVVNKSSGKLLNNKFVKID